MVVAQRQLFCILFVVVFCLTGSNSEDPMCYKNVMTFPPPYTTGLFNNYRQFKTGSALPGCFGRAGSCTEAFNLNTYASKVMYYESSTCWSPLHEHARKTSEQCFKKNTCFFFGINGQCKKPPIVSHEDYQWQVKTDKAAAQQAFNGNEDRTIMVHYRMTFDATNLLTQIWEDPNNILHVYPKPTRVNIRARDAGLSTAALCCQLEDTIHLGQCKKILASTPDFEDFLMKQRKTNFLIRDIPRNGVQWPGGETYWQNLYKNDEPTFKTEFASMKKNGSVVREIELCTIAKSDNSECGFVPASDEEAAEIFSAFPSECKGGICPKGTKCDEGAPSPDKMCYKCDETGCENATPEGKPELLDCGDGTKCVVRPSTSNVTTETTCDMTKDVKERCKVCNGNACSNEPADFVDPRNDVECKEGYCPVDMECNKEARDVKEMCKDGDGKNVEPNREPSYKGANNKCLGGMCPAGSKCNVNATSEDDLCMKGGKYMDPLFPPSVPCRGGLCPLGSTCNPTAQRVEEMCIGASGDFVTPLKEPEGVECNGGLCPKGSTCDPDACKSDELECLKMCKVAGGFVLPLFMGAVLCKNGVLCPPGSRCNNGTRFDDLCYSDDNEPLDPLRLPGVPCQGGSCPAGTECDVSAAPEKMCTNNDGDIITPLIFPPPPSMVCPGSSKYEMYRPGPSPWVFRGFHKPAPGSTEQDCVYHCTNTPNCGQAVFVNSTNDGTHCFAHYVQDGDDLCDSKHASEILWSCKDAGINCVFYNRVCEECNNMEHKILGKIAFCHKASENELVEVGKNYCNGAPVEKIVGFFSGLGIQS